jgi:hypothetical protein
MESKINKLLEKINLINTNGTLEETCAIIRIEDINDIILFNVAEISQNMLTINFNNWIAFDNNMIDPQYVSVFPQAIIRYVESAVYKITFEFYGYDDILVNVTYNLCTASVKHILNNLLNHQIEVILEVNNI